MLWIKVIYGRTPVTRTLKRNKKHFESAGNSSYQGKFQGNFDQGKENLVQVSGKFELLESESSRFYYDTVISTVQTLHS